MSPVTRAEYEDAYMEALRCLADSGHAVGKPFYDTTGTRYCIVDERKLNDEAVLKLWWGDEITRKILEGRPS